MEIILNEDVNLLNGIKTKLVELREPTPRDLLNISNIKQVEFKEITLISNLTSIDIESIKDMPMKDYKKLQNALEVIYSDDATSPK
ncbi:phage tail assembly protein [Thiotrichales bacterium 19X7-9]|nr:phage tail assembly protein [Thiotrichales bacterium 19X7-9]TNF69319.1 MAG: phage tail assembly protein [Gammaproteobacteria bacterium]UTW43804.1 phage tail assembly protein [bacterium SCSIO 12844]